MKLSTKTRYGLKAIIEIAKSYGRGPAKRKEIAAIHNISEAYLENILIILKNNGIIEAVRGSSGGYTLACHPSELTVLDVVEALEGKINIVDCVNSEGLEKACIKINTCVARGVWKEISDIIRKKLGEITIQSLIEKEKRDYIPMYSI